MPEQRRELTPDELIALQTYFKDGPIPEVKGKVIRTVSFTKQTDGLHNQTLIVMFAPETLSEQAPAAENAEENPTEETSEE